MEKSELRKRIAAQKRQLTPAQIARASEELARLLAAHPLYREAKSLYGYLSYNQEVLTPPILAQAQRDGKRVTSEQSAAAKRMENLPDIVEEQHRSNCARIDYLEAQIAALRDEVCPQFKKALADVEPVNPEDLEEG